jgi:hypothetical protein
VTKTCLVDGVPFEAKRAAAKYCSERCRKRAQRGHLLPVSTLPKPDVPDGVTVAQVRAELGAAGRADTYLGAAALALAERIDNATAVMGFAALVRELRVTMEAAMEGAGNDVDALTDIRSSAALKLIRPA